MQGILRDPETPGRIKRYFDPQGGFAGAWFERLDPYAHGTNDIGSNDILAVTLLHVAVPAQGVRKLLYDPGVQREVSVRLSPKPAR
ncbi:MAG: DUF6308 family protein [Actinomycetota bacterium]